MNIQISKNGKNSSNMYYNQTALLKELCIDKMEDRLVKKSNMKTIAWKRIK
jgi:hypothetical protein